MDGARDESEGTSGMYRWYVLLVLTLCNTLSFVDSKLPFILIEQIKRDLAVSDTIIGLITGPAFSVVFAVTAFPIARISDTRSRKAVLGFAVLIWSGFTAAAGLTRTSLQLVLSRAGVALGEAGCVPAAHSVIADYFGPTSRGLAISVFMTGAVLGTAIALIAGGWVAQHHSWRWAMYMVGASGLILSGIMFLTVREPRRDYAQARLAAASFTEVYVTMLRNKTILHSIAGGSLLCLSAGSIGAWLPAYVQRHFGLSVGRVGLTLGLASLAVGLLGTLLGGIVGDSLARRGGGAGYRFLAISFAACGLLRIWSFYINDYTVFLAVSSVATLLIVFYLGPTFATVQSLVDPQSRSRASALLGFAYNGLGIAGGAFFTGLLSDRLSPLFGKDALRIAMLIVSVALIPAAWHYWLGGRTLAGRTRSTVIAGESDSP
jgi:predicted MFS family arabinose efflux permease